MTPEELKLVLKLHLRWLVGGEDGVRASLTGADLTDATYLPGWKIAKK